ncbi:MAG: MFS transporter [Bacteriovoracaceae bacterium]|jgi:fucose permease|nr:MFS transporter [Bacteriovoracaceae bacterium]
MYDRAMFNGYIILSFLALFCVGLIDNSRGPIYPELLSLFNVTTSNGSLIFSISALSSFVTTVVSKFWLYRFRVLSLTYFALVLMGVSTLMMGLVIKYAPYFSNFLIFSAFFGISIGILSITLNVIINKNSNKDTNRRLFSALHSMYGLSSFLSPFIFSFIFTYSLDWKFYFISLGLLPLMIAFYFFMKLKKLPLSSEQKVGNVSIPLGLVIKLGIVISFYVASEVLVSSRMVLFLTKKWNFSNDDASGFLSIFFLLLLGGRVLFAMKDFNIKSKNLLLTSLMTSILCCILGIFIFPIFLPVSAIFMSYFFPCFMSFLSSEYHYFSENLVAKVMNFVGGAIFIMHYTFGQIAKLLNLDAAFCLVFLMLGTSLYILQFRLHRT